MKKNTDKQKRKSFFLSGFMLSIALFSVSSSVAQLQNNEPVFIGDDSYVFVGSGTYYFGASPGATQTTRTATTYGKLIFASGASTSGASDSHYLDGYARTLGNAAFIFPVGQAGVYAPVKAIPTTTDGVDAAYYRANPTTIGVTLDGTVSALSTIEYWDVKSALSDATLSFSWRASSDVTTLTGSTLADLTIVGWNGSAWVQIPSTVDGTSFLGTTSTLTEGSITSDFVVDLSLYSAFSLGSKGGACSPLIASSGITKTWNGSWSPSAPTLEDPVVINAAYSGPLACNSLILNADVTLANGQTLEIVNGASGSGKIIMASQASVVQRNQLSTAPNIELTKQTRDLHVNDYVYWGTPIAGNFFSQLAAAQALTGTVAGAFDLKFRYNSGSGGGWVPLTTITTGRGYIMRVKQQAPFTSSSATDKINLKFTGVANNGDVSVSVTNNPTSPNGGTSHNLLANPYPCAIDGDKFLTDNTDIDGVIYVWQAATPPASGTGVYSQADYIAYTLAGTVTPSAIPTTFNGKIASGQGFKVKALSTTGNVTFTNCMRLTADNTSFFKTSVVPATPAPRDRFKLNMTDGGSVFSQILVAYMPQATLDYDRMYDAGRNSVSTAQLFSVLESDGRKLAINARPSFVNTDVVPLGITKTGTNAETFTISITEKEGVFNTPNVNVYIHDLQNGTYHNLNNGNFSFTTNSTSITNRFEVVYQVALSNTDFDSHLLLANINNSVFTVKANIGMTTIEIFDIAGKLIHTYDAEGETSLEKPFNHAEGVYIAKIKLDNDVIATEKLINVK